MELNYKTLIGYVTEVEIEVLGIGDRKCNKFEDESQLCAVLMLVIRASSLLRSVLAALENDQLDAYDAVRRAYLETWFLALDFRLKESEQKAFAWHRRRGDTWSAEIKLLEQYAKKKGVTTPSLGRDYGGLSRVAHPTKDAAENSLVMTGARHGDKRLEANLKDSKSRFENHDMPELMYRYLWLVLEEGDELISIGSNEKFLPTGFKYAENYMHELQKKAAGSR